MNLVVLTNLYISCFACSKQDSAWVRDNLNVSETVEKNGIVSKFALETKYDFKLCESRRDFSLGKYVQDLIMNAIQTSRRIIIVLSE